MYKTKLCSAVLFGSLLAAFCVTAPSDATAQFASHGYLSNPYAYLGLSTKCAPDEAEHSLRLSEINPANAISEPGIEVQFTLYELTGGSLVKTEMPRQLYSTSLSYCAHHDDYVRWDVYTPSGSLYHDKFTLASRSDNSSLRNHEQGRHYQQNIHLQRVGESNGQSLTATNPVQTIVTSPPNVYEYQLHPIPSPLVANITNTRLFWVTDVATLNEEIRISGAYTQAPGNGSVNWSGTLPDGLYAWDLSFRYALAGQNFAGESYSHRLFSGHIGSSPTRPQFLLDQTQPAASATAVPNGSGVDLVVTAQDSTSGLASVQISVTDTSVGSVPSVSTTNFPLGSGVTGGPTSNQTITLPVSTTPGHTYSYSVVVTDAAGNVRTLPAQTYTETIPPVTVSLTPTTINAVRCEITDITPPPAESGVCPPIPVTMVVRNDSGADLVAATHGPFPYEFEYREMPSGPWVSADSGTYNSDVSDGATFTVNGMVNALPTFGAYEVRGTIDGQSISVSLTRDPYSDPVPTPDTTISIGTPTPYGSISISAGGYDIVRSNTVVPVSWIVEAPIPLECQVSGPGINVSFTHDPLALYPPDMITDSTSAPVDSAALQNFSEFTIDCVPQAFNGFTPPTGTVYTAIRPVEVIPDFQEI